MLLIEVLLSELNICDKCLRADLILNKYLLKVEKSLSVQEDLIVDLYLALRFGSTPINLLPDDYILFRKDTRIETSLCF